MSDGNAGECWPRHCRGYAGNDLARNAGRGQRQRFFATAAEYEWVAALEADHAFAAQRTANHDSLDRLL